MLRYATGVGLSRTTVSDLDMGRRGGRCCWRFFNGVGLSQPVSVSKDTVRWVVGCWTFEMHKIKTFACNKDIWKYKKIDTTHVKVCIVSGRFAVLKNTEKLMSNGCSDTPVRTSTTEIVTWSRPRLSHGHEQ